MRISKFQKEEIEKTARLIFGKKTIVYLFGSRLYDSKKGGDIDLLIKLDNSENDSELFNKKLKFLVHLKKKIGEQKIDVLIDYGQQEKRSFYNEIYQSAIVLKA